MSPRQALPYLLDRPLVDRDGNVDTARLLPGLSPAEIDAFARRLPCPIPDEIRELLAFSRGVDGVWEGIDFGGDEEFDDPDLFPGGYVRRIMSDGQGNDWVLDLSPESKTWGPIYFASHDPPVLLYQAADLTEFLHQIAESYTPPYDGVLYGVWEDSICDVWMTNPDLLSQPDAVWAEDPALRRFAESLSSEWLIADLRQAKPGDGFSWGRYRGEMMEIRRDGLRPIFAYRMVPQTDFQ
jgi:hypothetical protein